MVRIFDVNGDELMNAIVSEKSYRVREIMGDNKLFLFISLPRPERFPLHCYCIFQGERYMLLHEENFKKINTQNHEYTLEMDTYAAYLRTQKLEFFTLQRSGGTETINSDREIEFTLHLTPREYVQLIVDNMNQKDRSGGWKVGDCIEDNPMLIDFNDSYCHDALIRVADTFSTEYEILGKTIHLRKVETDKDNPIPLAYGKGNGLLPGIGRTNYKNRIAVLRVKTSERNIDRATYGSKTLRMPKNHIIEYEGIRYITDSTGSTITRETPIIAAPILPEETLDLTSIYPHRVGTVSSVVAVDDSKGLYDFTDTANTIDYADNIIPGETMTVIFQNGKIAGTPLDVHNYVHQEARFELVSFTEHGVTIPQGTLIPAAGDKYAVFHINLPHEYIETAETELLNAAVKFLHENEQPQFTYSARLDGVFAKRNWKEIGGRLALGRFIRLTDPQYLDEPVDIRIVGVRDYVEYPYSPDLTFSNSVVGKTMGSVIRQLPNQEQTIERAREDAVRYSRLRFRDAKELASRLQDALLNFEEGINPVSVHAMMEYLGDESLQFRWVDDKTNPQEIDHDFAYNPQTKVFSAPAGIIQHMTLGIDSLAPDHAPSEYKFWDIISYTSPALDGMGPLWLYLKCEKNGADGSFLLSADAIPMDSDPNYYYFLTGHLNSELEGERNFVTLYGFSMWTPGAMRVNKVVNTDGTQYWDMLNKRFRIGDNNSFISYNVDEAGRLVLKGTLVQSPSGALDNLGVDRGNYVSGTTYYPGDMVKYTDGNIYKCLQQTTAVPTNTTYWKLMVSKGDKGNTGDTGSTGAKGTGYKYAYYPSNSLTPPATPSSPGVIPSGWWTYPNFNGCRYIYVSQCIETNGSWSGWTGPVIYSVVGEDGDPGPAIVYCGKFAAGVYYNNAARRDVVEFGGTYYIYKGSDGATNSSWSSGNWENFGAQFRSVATDLLLAVNANVGGWIFKNERLESQSGGAYLDGRNGTVAITGKFSTGGSGRNRIEIDPATRSIRFLDSYGDLVASMDFSDSNEYGAASPKLTLVASDGSPYVGATVVDNKGITIRGSRAGSILAQFTKDYISANLPTSSVNLPSGTFYSDGGTVKVKL
jgi:hypothetical protein